MTSPVPGQDQQSWETETAPSAPQRERGFVRNIGRGVGRGHLVVTIVAALVVLVGAAGSVWWFSGRNTPSNHPVAAPPPPSTIRHTPRPTPTPDNAAYGVGTCLTEPIDPDSGGLELDPVSCDGDVAVLVINQVVTDYNDCQQGADYINHGFILNDKVANVFYCASLVVQTNQCFEFSTNNSTPIQRADCGSAANVVKVNSVEPAASVSQACTDLTAPDIWYFQSPTSGQFACVSALPPGASSTNNP